MTTVRIFHPSLPETITQPAVVSAEAFDQVWSQPEPPHRPEPWQLWPPDPELADHADVLAAALRSGDGDRDRTIRALAASGVDRDEAAAIFDRLVPPEPKPKPKPKPASRSTKAKTSSKSKTTTSKGAVNG